MLKPLLIVAAVVPLLCGSVAPSEARGCIKGAIAGGVAGHYAGHPYVGAAGGCLMGRRLAAQQRARAHEQAAAQQGQPGAAYTSGASMRPVPPAQPEGGAPGYSGGAYARPSTPAQSTMPAPGYTGGTYQR